MLGWALGLLGIGGMGAAIAFIPGALPVVLGALRAAWGFVLKYPLQAALLVALVAVAWLWRANGHQKQAIGILAGKVVAERKAHEETVANYRAAQVLAEEAQRANLARTARQRAAIDERQINALKADRDSAAARADRLRVNLDTLKRQASNLDLSTIMEATCRTFEATGCDGLSAKLKAAQDNTDQLVRLQEAVEQQAEIETSPGSPQ